MAGLPALAATQLPARAILAHPFRLSALDPGWQGMFSRFMYNVYVHQWGLLHGERLLGVAAWQSTAARANWLWLAAPPAPDEEAIRALLVYARRYSPTQRPLVLDYPAIASIQPSRRLDLPHNRP